MIFENSSPKGIFGPNMSDSPNWSLTANSRSLHAAAVKFPTISGRPDELFFLPELHGRVDGLLHPILDDEIQSMRENLTYEEEKSIYQEYFECVLENTELQLPHIKEEGLFLIKNSLKLLT